MKRCLPMPQRFIQQHHDRGQRISNLERMDGGQCGYQRADCGEDLNANHFYRFEEDTGNFQDEIGDADLIETGAGTALTRHASGADAYAISWSDADWRDLFGGARTAFPMYGTSPGTGLFDMSLGSFAIGAYIWPSSTNPGSNGGEEWAPICGQGSGETTTGDYEGMLWYNWLTGKIAVCFNHYQFHTASKDGNPLDQFLNGHFKESVAALTPNAWNKVIWVHDDAANKEKLYVNTTALDVQYTSEDAGAVATEPFMVGDYQWADHFLAQFFAADEYRFLGGGSRIDNVMVWTTGVPTSGEIHGFMKNAGNLAENGSWVITSGHAVTKVRVKKNGS